MNVIYEPRGPAREYAPLAVNLYRGCIHGCSYCYVPAIFRESAEKFHGSVAPRKDILALLQKDIAKLPSPCPRVHLCFTCDPYPPTEVEAGITREALLMFRDAGVPVSVLSKAGRRGLRDLDILSAMDSEVGVTLAWADDAKRRTWEPLAATVEERLEYLAAAHALGVKTWVSMEPVIEPSEALAILPSLLPVCDLVKVGRWNHDERSKAIDWKPFAVEIKRLLVESHKPYLLKKGLFELAN